MLIVIDTLRRDHLGCYGAQRETSPAIDAFAAHAVRFERAYTTAPWTQPAVASMLTGLYPSGHGLKRPGRLSGTIPTLAERLGDAGYATAAVVSHTLLKRRHGFDRGFERWDESPAAFPVRDSTSDAVTQAAQLALAALAADARPFFLLVHYFDPHYEYLRHPDVGFAAPRAGRLDGSQSVAELRAMVPLRNDERELLTALYDEEIRHTDAAVGRLLDALAASGRAENALIVLTADHGEEFQERGWIGHTNSLYDELMRVPLIVRPPGGAGAPADVDALVSLVSLTPTVLDYAGVRAEPAAASGRSWRPLLEGRALAPLPVLLEVDFVPLRPERQVKRAHKKAVVAGP